MCTQEIADRRRLFELFTWLLEHRAAAKDPQAERKREDEVQGTVKHCIELWTGMMKVRLRPAPPMRSGSSKQKGGAAAAGRRRQSPGPLVQSAPLTIFSVRRRVRLSTTTSLLRELWGWFPTRTGWHCASAKRCRLLPAPLFQCCRAGLAWTAVLLSKQLAHAALNETRYLEYPSQALPPFRRRQPKMTQTLHRSAPRPRRRGPRRRRRGLPRPRSTAHVTLRQCLCGHPPRALWRAHLV